MMTDHLTPEPELDLTPEPELDLAAMAGIVRDLLAGGADRLRDKRWLRERAEASGLCAQACAALEALRTRLCAGGPALLDATVLLPWN